jgi:myosin heavy subunit
LQLCINFCNEKLQFHFNEHIFRLEQILYESEGITISSTDFQDNQPTLDLLEAKITGVFSMCDEEISVPRGSDDGMLQKLYQKHMGKHPNLLRPKAKECLDNLKCFGILHYAGPVYYNVNNFLEKNKDQVHQDILGALKGSNKPLITEMFEERAEPAAAPSKATRGRAATSVVKKAGGAKTLGAQFKQQLNELMETLNSTFPHFIRCMKPNDKKVGNLFAAGRMVDQLRYAGLVEVCRIRKLGYPVRRDFEVFFKRYRCCDTTARDLDALLQSLVNQKCLQSGEWAKGNSKVFLRTTQSINLELRREKAFGEVAVNVQKMMRAHLARKRFSYWMKLLQKVKDGIAAREEEALTYAIDMSFELPWGGSHLQVIKDAKVLQARLREENRVKQLLQNAISAREMSSLKSAIAAAESMHPPVSTPLIAQAKEVLLRLVEENKVKSDLTAAIDSRNRSALATLLKKAGDMGMDCNETRQATTLLTRLEEEDKAMDTLKKALAAREMEGLEAALAKCSSMGLEGADITSGNALLRQLSAERDAKIALANAIKDREMNALLAALAQASSMGLSASTAEVVEGNKLKTVLENEAAAVADLESAADRSDLAALESAITRATAAGLTAATCSSLDSAIALRDSLVAEQSCREALRAAIQSNNRGDLAKSLAEASRLGISGGDVEEARAKSKALGARSDTLDRLSALASGDMLEDIAAALAEAEKMGLVDTAEAQAAIAKSERLREERALVDDLDRLTHTATTANQQELSRVIAQAMRMGLSTKFPDKMTAAKNRAKVLGEEVQFTMKIELAFRNNDMGSLKEIVAEAAAAGQSTAFGEKKMEELKERQAITASLETSLLAKDKDAVMDLLKRATNCGLSNETVNQAKLFADRAGMEDRLYQAFEKAEREMNLKALNEALETAIELGLRTPAVEKAQHSRAKLEVFDNAASDITAAAQVVVVKLESGIVSGDLAALESAIAKAQEVCEVDLHPLYHVLTLLCRRIFFCVLL